MHTRRETAADILANARDLMAEWEDRLRHPPDVVTRRDGTGQAIESQPVPAGAMVLQALGEEETIKLRAELHAVAATLEGLAAS